MEVVKMTRVFPDLRKDWSDSAPHWVEIAEIECGAIDAPEWVPYGGTAAVTADLGTGFQYRSNGVDWAAKWRK